MSSEPPSETSPTEDERIAAEFPDPSGNRGRGRWTSVAAALGVLAVAGGVAAFLFLSSDPDPPTNQAAPAQGLACPDLREAAEAHEQGDSASFDRSIAQAAEVAEQTLQTSGQVFGDPERIALELSLSDGGRGSSARAERLLEQALQDCRDIEST
jgi:flagellar basal body-associated protein FliL